MATSRILAIAAIGVLTSRAVHGEIRLVKASGDDTKWEDIQRLFFGVIQRASLNCVREKENQLRVVKRIVCETALTTSTGISPDIPTMLKSIGNDFLVCMRQEVPKLTIAHCKQQFTVEVKFGNSGWKAITEDSVIRTKELFDAIKQEVEKATKKPLTFEQMPGVERVRWLAPLVSYVLSVDADVEDKNAAVDTKGEDATVAESDRVGKAIEDAKGKVGAGFVDFLTERLKSIGATDKTLQALGDTFTRGGMTNLVLNGWGIVKDAACDVFWVITEDAMLTNINDAVEGLTFVGKEGTGWLAKGLLLMPTAVTDKSKALAAYRDAVIAAEAEKKKQQAAMPRYGVWGTYVERAIFYKIAKRLSKPVNDRMYEIDAKAAEDEIKKLIDYTVTPISTSLWFMKDYEMKELNEANSKDVLRALQHSTSYCQTAFRRADMRSLMCDRGTIMKRETEEKLVRFAIRTDNGRIDRIRTNTLKEDEKDEYSKCVGQIEAKPTPPVNENDKAAMEQYSKQEAKISKQIMLCMDSTRNSVGDDGQFDQVKFKARLEQITKLLYKLMDEPDSNAPKAKQMLENPLKRHLLVKAALYTQCVRIQAANAMYDAKKAKKYPSVTFEQRLSILRDFHNKVEMIKEIMKTACDEDMVTEFDDAKLEEQHKQEAIILGNLKNKSFVTKFLAMVLISLPASKSNLKKEAPSKGWLKTWWGY